ncbi:unnamed protein product, partial [Notodromas monacha]
MRLLVFTCFLATGVALRVRGVIDRESLLIAKFGFQKTVSTEDIDTRGYVFGNVSSNSDLDSGLTMSLLPGGYFDAFSDHVIDSDESCRAAFAEIGGAAYDSACNPSGAEDFLRRVPCDVGTLCKDEDQPKLVVKYNQFTYIVEDFQHPRFWFLSISPCRRQPSLNCTWKYTAVPNGVEIKYDIWLVNGNPYKTERNPLEYQFSFEKQDTAELYLVFLLTYAVLCVVSWCNWRLVKYRLGHPVFVLLASIVCMFLGLGLTSLHVCLFAVDGVGLPALGCVARFLRTFSQ